MTDMKKIFVTGADGFIGKKLVSYLIEKNYFVKPGLWRGSKSGITGQNMFSDRFYFEELSSETDWSEAFKGEQTDTVIHLAARAHVLKERSKDPYSEYKTVNCLGTQKLAAQAAASNVRRFIYISSAGVHGSFTKSIPFKEENPESPFNYYSISKYCAEKKLRKIESQTNMEVVIIRPPLVYGPGVKANFRRFLDLIYKGIPLPFKKTGNLRSLIFIDNLADAIEKCINHPDAASQTFLVSDGTDISTEELAQKSAYFMGKDFKNFYFPSLFFKILLNAAGKKNIYDGLWRSLEIDSSKIRNKIGWTPPFDMNSGLETTVKDYLKLKKD